MEKRWKESSFRAPFSEWSGQWQGESPNQWQRSPDLQNVEMLIELSDYAVEGRYSIIHDDLNESEKYIEIIERLLKHA